VATYRAQLADDPDRWLGCAGWWQQRADAALEPLQRIPPAAVCFERAESLLWGALPELLRRLYLKVPNVWSAM
jgi:hypothetical protein